MAPADQAAGALPIEKDAPAVTADPAPEVEPEAPSPEQAAEAGKREAEGEDHRIEYRAREDSEPLQLKLPPKLRMSVIARAAVLRDDDFQGSLRMLEAILGADQYSLVMDAMDEAELGVDEDAALNSIGELIQISVAAYGLSPGESQASSES